MNKTDPWGKPWQYFVLAFLLWVVVDFGTAGGFRLAYFEKYGPALLLFYVGSPLTFTFLIFKKHWSEKRLFFATLLAIFVVEVIFTRNPLVMSFPALLVGIPLAIGVYAPLTYFPLWWVRKEMHQRRLLVFTLSALELIVMALTTFGAAGG